MRTNWLRPKRDQFVLDLDQASMHVAWSKTLLVLTARLINSVLDTLLQTIIADFGIEFTIPSDKAIIELERRANRRLEILLSNA